MIRKESYFAALCITLLLILDACQGVDETSQTKNEVSHQESDEEAASETDSAKDNQEDAYSTENNNNEKKQSELGESNGDTSSEDSAAKEENTESEDGPDNNITGTDYSSEQEAVDAIKNYEIVEETNTDLGHGIEALSEGATGHHYITWNEGKWLIRVNAPTDPEFATGNYEDGEELARSVLDYLEKNYLPAPDQRGVIEINDFDDHPGTVIRWQQGSTVYEMDERTDNPIAALQKAVDRSS